MDSQPPQVRRPTNSAIILVFGVLSLLGLPILGPVAWIMGNQSLHNIDHGWADAADRGMVSIGKIFGMVGTVVLCLAIIIYAVYALFLVRIIAPITNLTNQAVVESSAPAGQQTATQEPSPNEDVDAAIVEGKLAVVKSLVFAHPDIVKHRNQSGETPLFSAAFFGQTDIVKFLLAHGANVNAQDDFGRTPLDQALFSHRQDTAILLKQDGAVRGKSSEEQ